MPNDEIERLVVIQRWPTVLELEVHVAETIAEPRSFQVQIVGGPNGLFDVSTIDATEPGARAKAISLAETVHDVLEVAEMSWDIDDTPNTSAPST